MARRPVDLIRARVARAYELLNALKAEREGFVASNSEAILSEEHPDRTALKLTSNIREEPLDVMSILYSDAIHNLRSALDNVVYALWTANTGSPPEPEVRRFVGFPIFTQRREYETRRGSLTKGIVVAADTVIEEEQPYNRRRDAPHKDPLWVLHELSNIDKHRAPRAVYQMLDTIDLDGVRIFDAPDGYQPPLEYGAEIGVIPFSEPVPPGVEMELNITVRVGIEYAAEGPGRVGILPLLGYLTFAISRVEGIITRLARFL